MKITIFWTGYVWLVTWACLADLWHEVLCIDVDEKKIENLKKWIIPIYEHGLEEIVKKNIKNHRLTFSINQKEWIEFWKVIFNAVWTPPDEQDENKADLKYVKQVATTFWKFIWEFKLLINKSTVPVGTWEILKTIINEELKKRGQIIPFEIVSNPEFLREGTAIKDFMLPDRIVCWVESPSWKEIMEDIYKPILRNYSSIFFTDVKSAELSKYAANTFLATKISFINEMANFAELVWANIQDVSKAIGLDKRIGNRFLHAGIGYGGSCFPKDVKALIASGKEIGFNFLIPSATESINENQKIKLVKKIKSHTSLVWKNVCIWWLSFKPKTDDIREAPSLKTIELLLFEWVNQIHCHDPIAWENFKKTYSHEKVIFHEDMYEALKNADILMILTEWDEFRIADLTKIKEIMKGNLIADGRNILDIEEVKSLGFNYISIGK